MIQRRELNLLNSEMLSFVVPVTVQVTYVFRRIPLDLASMSRKSLDISKGWWQKSCKELICKHELLSQRLSWKNYAGVATGCLLPCHQKVITTIIPYSRERKMKKNIVITVKTNSFTRDCSRRWGYSQMPIWPKEQTVALTVHNWDQSFR